MGFVAKALDRAIEEIAPRWAESRSVARYRAGQLSKALERSERRRERRGFDSAGRTRRTGGWWAPGSSANTETRGALAVIRNRARDLRRNSAWAAKAERKLVTNIVGTGFTPNPRTADLKLKAKVIELWKSWSEDPEQIDAAGILDFRGMQALAVGSVVGSGEAIARRRRVDLRGGNLLPLQIQMLEPDHLDDQLDSVHRSSGSRIIQGVEVSKRGRRQAFHLLEDHPGEQLFSGAQFRSVRVAARDVMHMFRVERIGQLRGIPWGSPCLLRLRDYDGFVDAELLRQEIAAMFVGFVHDAGAAEDSSPLARQVENDVGEDIQQFEPGTWQRLGPEEQITFGEPKPFSSLKDYANLTLHEIASGYGVTYEQLSGDLSNVTFVSGRLGVLENQADVATWRATMFVPQFCRTVWKWFMDAAVLAEKLPGRIGADWTPPRMVMLDPVKEMNGVLAQIRAGLLSLSEAARATGKTRDELLQELAEDKRRAEDLGLDLSVFRAAGPGAPPPGSSQGADGDAGSRPPKDAN